MSASATAAAHLDGRALHRSVGAVHAAVDRDWTQVSLAALTFVEKLTRIRWHRFGFGAPAMRTRERRVKNHSRHCVHILGVAGKPASVDAFAKRHCRLWRAHTALNPLLIIPVPSRRVARFGGNGRSPSTRYPPMAQVCAYQDPSAVMDGISLPKGPSRNRH